MAPVQMLLLWILIGWTSGNIATVDGYSTVRDGVDACATTCRSRSVENTMGTVNQWDSTEFHRPKDRSLPKPSVGTQAAVYRRSFKLSKYPHVEERAPDNLERILVFGGYPDPPNTVRGSWVYTPIVNSWYRLPRSSHSQPADRTGHAMLSLCETSVVLFGGFQDRERYAFNDT